MQKVTKICICILLFSCKSTAIRTYNKQMKEVFIYDFKVRYFRKLLKEGFNNSESIKSILKHDISGFGEMILTMDDLNLIDSLVNIDNQKMTADSISRSKLHREWDHGKRVFDYALLKYNSKWLDSLARASYRLSAKSLRRQ